MLEEQCMWVWGGGGVGEWDEHLEKARSRKLTFWKDFCLTFKLLLPLQSLHRLLFSEPFFLWLSVFLFLVGREAITWTWPCKRTVFSQIVIHSLRPRLASCDHAVSHFTMGQLTLTGSPNAWGWQTLSNQTYRLVNKVPFYGGLEKKISSPLLPTTWCQAANFIGKLWISLKINKIPIKGAYGLIAMAFQVRIHKCLV